MAETIFRKKSMDRISSPEHMDDYIKVSSPGVWLLLAAIAALLIGACVWSVFGRLDSTIEAAVLVENGVGVCWLPDQDAAAVETGMPVEFGGVECTVAAVSGVPVQLTSGVNDYYLHVSGLAAGTWTRAISVGEAPVADGVYPAQIVVERLAPISFVLN